MVVRGRMVHHEPPGPLDHDRHSALWAPRACPFGGHHAADRQEPWFRPTNELCCFAGRWRMDAGSCRAVCAGRQRGQHHRIGVHRSGGTVAAIAPADAEPLMPHLDAQWIGHNDFFRRSADPRRSGFRATRGGPRMGRLSNDAGRAHLSHSLDPGGGRIAALVNLGSLAGPPDCLDRPPLAASQAIPMFDMRLPDPRPPDEYLPRMRPKGMNKPQRDRTRGGRGGGG